MLRFAVFALLVAAATAASTRGVIGGIIPCGSKGEVLEVRVTDCTTLPCQLTVGKTYTVEVDFIPSADHPFLTVEVDIFANGQYTPIISADVEVSVVAGTAYTVAYPLPITGTIATGPIALRIRVSGDTVIELCGLATAVVSNPRTDIIF